MASINPLIWLRLNWVTRFVVVLVLAFFVWLNVDYTRDNYVAGGDGSGYSGGVRYGFPCAWYDAGRHATASLGKGGHFLQTEPYGGIQWLGLGADLLMLLAALVVTTLVCETLRRKLQPSADAAAAAPNRPATQLGWLTGAGVIACLAAVVWNNLQITTYIAPDPDAGIAIQHQEMGWPLTTYRASEPVLLKQAQFGMTDSHILFKANPDLWRRRAHWEERNIVLNIFIALALSGLAGALCQRLQKFNLRSNKPLP